MSRPSRSPSASQISEKPASVGGTWAMAAACGPWASHSRRPSRQLLAVAAGAQALAGDGFEVGQFERLQAAAVCRGA